MTFKGKYTIKSGIFPAVDTTDSSSDPAFVLLPNGTRTGPGIVLPFRRGNVVGR
jgi:hypothetical protein